MANLKSRRRELRSNGFWVNFLGITPLVWGCALLFLVVWGLNVALGDPDKQIVSVCGTKSGRDLDKIAELGLTLEDGETVSVPGIKEMPLTLECKVIYKQDQDKTAIDPECDARYYAKGTPNEDDYHTVYYGQITKAYILE